jgi:hypothetical protein
MELQAARDGRSKPPKCEAVGASGVREQGIVIVIKSCLTFSMF